ncbi:pyridoxal phosphate-dependent aminotransferase [Reichenbachiella versicolor]|uniref:pyridoxal phosphate-dependent aminotransferase n=1 Tax=Reichenbachiella versicolor TaxID=1821036 RepID=UPI000D6E5FA7|nr:aminotransferase class I/II-fold pyridoxal phosphate-dependent enzyme [Reichenbachiella versicolor]
MINGHGDDKHLFEVEIEHNFSSNVFYEGCPPDLIKSLVAHSNIIENYPSPDAGELARAAAKRFKLSDDQFLFTNGATEAFYLIAHVFSDKKVAIAAPTFAEYEDACKIHELNYELVSRNDFSPSDFELVFICNPNNPDGSLILKQDLKSLIENHPKTIFVIDEAYIEFTTQTKSILSSINELNNLIVVRSLTKTFTIPGIRLGYIAAQSSVIQLLLTKKIPWSVNAMAIQSGLEIFDNYDKWQFDAAVLMEETKLFSSQVADIKWLDVKPSQTSYFLVELLEGKANELKKYLALEHQILIRDATNFNRLEGEYIRLATQSPASNQALIKALINWR